MDKRYLLLALALLLGGFLVFSPHLTNSYPLHIDEWRHITLSENLLQSGSGFLTFMINNPLETGFHIFLIFVNFFFNLVTFYQFLPLLNFLAISLVLFYFLRKKYNFWVGLFVVLFLSSLKSNVNISGLWFFVPLTLAIPFIYLFLFLLEDTFESNKKFILVLASLFLVSFIHQSTFAVLSLTFILFFIFRKNLIKINYKYLSYFSILLLPILLAGLFLFRTSLSLGIFFNKFIFGPGIIQINYNLFLLYGIVPSIFALIGFFYLFKKKELLPIRIYFLISAFNLILFSIFHFSIFSSYQRYVYHLLLSGVVLSSVGLYFSLRYFYLKLFFVNNNLFKKILVFVLALLLICSSFIGYYSIHPQAKLYTIINDADYHAMVFFKNYSFPTLLQNYKPELSEVISLPSPGVALPALARKSSISGIFFALERGKIDSVNFFNSNCADKKEILSHWENLKYIYSYSDINCSFLENIYSYGGVWIYTISPN